MKRLEISCIGPPAVRVDRRVPAADVLWRKHLALLIYLALSPGRTRARSHLVGLLWPEKTAEQARHSLNEAVHRLRACLGAGRLVSEGETVALGSGDLDVDLWRFEEAAARNPDGAVELLRGDLLEGLALEDAPAFEEWAEGERMRFRARAVEVLVAQGERHLASAAHGDALAAGRRALAVDPFSEPAARLAMRAAALAGDGAGALASYHAFTERLAAELGEQPSRSLAALCERIRNARWRKVAAGEVTGEPPLCGRAPLHRNAFALLAQGMSSGPRTLFITGHPGMGKSRLLDECADRLRLDGALVAHGRPLESDADAPWSMLRQLMRGGLLGAPGITAADPEALGTLASLMPALAERFPPREVRDAAQVASAFEGLVAAIADERPLGLAIDDVHHADQASLATLDAALAELAGRGAPVVMVATAPEAPDSASRALLRFRGNVGGRLPGLVVRLDPLVEPEVRELVAAMASWCDQGQRDRLARRIAHESGGSPFLAVTLLQALRTKSVLREELLAWPARQRTYEAPLPFSVPHLARMAIIVRFSELDESARGLLLAASVAGHVWDLDLVSSLTAMPVPQIVERLGTLERHHFVQFNGERYAFAAPLIADVLCKECLTPGRVGALRSAAIERLASRSDFESRVLRTELRALNEPGPSAFDEAAEVARAALAAGSRRCAARAVAAARRALGGGGSAAALAELEGRLAE